MVDETRVRYKAITDFTSLARAVRTAKRNLKELREEEARLNKESVLGSARATIANNKRAESVRNLGNAYKGQGDSVRRSTVTFVENARATRDSASAQQGASKATKEAASATDTLANATRRSIREAREAKNAAEALAGVTRRSLREERRRAAAMRETVQVADRLNTSFRRLGNWRPRLTPPFIALIPIIAGLLGLMNPLVAALGAAGTAAFGFASSLGSVVGAALTAVPALGTLLSMVFALKTAFGGIGGAFKAFGQMRKATGGGGGGGGGSNRAELTQQEEITRAQEKYARAIQDVAWAQEDLADARKDYLKRLKELRKEVDRIAASEARAAANVQLARENYANVLADPGSTKGEKMAAKADLEESQQEQKDLKEENAQLKKDLADMEKKGMSGDRDVIQAQRRLTDAIWAQRDAQLALINAQKGANQAAGGGASAVNAYEEALKKLSPSARRFVETLVAMSDAWDGLKKRVQERFFSQFVDNVDRLRLLFDPLESLLGDSAEALGRFVDKFLLLITSPAWRNDIVLFGKGNVPIIDAMGEGVLSLLDGIRNLAVAAQPALLRLARGFERGSEALSNMIAGAREDGSLASFLDRSIDRLAQWWRIVKNVGKTIFNFGKAAGDFSQWLTDGFEETTEGWLSSSEEALGPNSKFKQYLEDIKPLVSEIKGLFGDFFRWFGREASDTDNIAQAIKILQTVRDDLGPSLARLFDKLSEAEVGPKFVDAVSKLVDIITSLSNSPAVAVFFDVLNALLEVAKWVVSNPVLGSLLGVIASGFAAIAAISFVGKFSGLTSLIGWLLKLARGGKGLPGLLTKILGALGVGGLGSLGAGGAASVLAKGAKGGTPGVYAAGTRRGPGGGSEKRVAGATKGGAKGGGVKGGAFGKGLGILTLITEAMGIYNSGEALVQSLSGEISSQEAGLKALGGNMWISITAGLVDAITGSEQGTALNEFNNFLLDMGSGIQNFFSNQDEQTAAAERATQGIIDNVKAYEALGAQIDIAKQKMIEGNWTTQQTIDMFTPYTDSIYDTSQAMLDAGQPYAQYESYLRNQRQKLYDSFLQMGYNKDEAKALSDRLVAIPDEGHFQMGSNLADVQREARDTGKSITDLPSYKEIHVKTFWESVGDLFTGKGWTFGQYNGGPVQKRNKGGVIYRAGGGGVPGVRSNSDTVPAMLTPGEFVVRKAIVNRVGIDNLTKFNAGVMSYAEMLQSAMASANSGGKSKNVGGGDFGFFNGGGLVPDLPDTGGFFPRPPGGPAGGFGEGFGGGGDAPVIGGDLIINNPAPETASDSLPRTIRKVAYLGGRK